jgi:hypothetical protein
MFGRLYGDISERKVTILNKSTNASNLNASD